MIHESGAKVSHKLQLLTKEEKKKINNNTRSHSGGGSILYNM